MEQIFLGHDELLLSFKMARALNIMDIIVIAVLVIIAALIIYLLRPLIIAIVIIAAGYFIYRWYTKRKIIRSTY